ncbi:MAG: hypothetical protein H7337_11910 [Rhizobacter sp.]|nr:hypothetical protein [Rhizobacter sp.]
MRASWEIVWLKALAICPSNSGQSVGNLTQKSPSRNAAMARRIWRERASGEPAAARGALFKPTRALAPLAASSGFFFVEEGIVVRLMVHRGCSISVARRLGVDSLSGPLSKGL